VRGAARRPIVGAQHLVDYLVKGLAKFGVKAVATAIWVNGEPGLRVDADGSLGAIVTLEVEHGKITHVFSIANPEKLMRVDTVTMLSRSPTE
jgi:RNA polymerase sigma-70 factor (ECF subfamily)